MTTVIANALVVLGVWLVFGVITAIICGRLLTGRYWPWPRKRRDDRGLSR